MHSDRIFESERVWSDFIVRRASHLVGMYMKEAIQFEFSLFIHSIICNQFALIHEIKKCVICKLISTQYIKEVSALIVVNQHLQIGCPHSVDIVTLERVSALYENVLMK